MKTFEFFIQFIKSLFQSKQVKDSPRFPYLFYFGSDVQVRAGLSAAQRTEHFMLEHSARVFVISLPFLKAWPEQDFVAFMQIVTKSTKSNSYTFQEIDTLEKEMLGWRVTGGLAEPRLAFWHQVYEYLYTEKGKYAIAVYSRAITNDQHKTKEQELATERANLLYHVTEEVVYAAKHYLDTGCDKESKVYLIQTTGTAGGKTFKTVQLSEPFAPKINLSDIPISGICFMTLDHCSKLTY